MINESTLIEDNIGCGFDPFEKRSITESEECVFKKCCKKYKKKGRHCKKCPKI